jgi:hypothetical protein
MRRLWSIYPLILALGALPLAGCGPDEAPRTISDIRERDKPRYELPADLTVARRYGYRKRSDMPAGHGGPARTSVWAWTTPDGWEEKARGPGSIRLGSWAVTGEPLADCSLVSLGGDGGGLLLNVNRWRGEMGVEPLEAAGLKDLAERTLLESPATYVDIVGQFSGGQASGGKVENARMLGLILTVPRATLFLKFTGPVHVVEAHRAAFEALGDSITFGAPTPDPTKGADPATPPPARGGRFVWDGPAGWDEQPARMMRIVTFVPKSEPASWCYVSKLGGTAGGLANNVNRWRGEMGERTVLDEAAIGKLPTLDVLGVKAVLLDLKGDFAGTGGPPLKGARMFGVICPRAGDVVFIKMVGPAATVGAHYDAFVALCTSLREAK